MRNYYQSFWIAWAVVWSAERGDGKVYSCEECFYLLSRLFTALSSFFFSRGEEEFYLITKSSGFRMIFIMKCHWQYLWFCSVFKRKSSTFVKFMLNYCHDAFKYQTKVKLFKFTNQKQWAFVNCFMIQFCVNYSAWTKSRFRLKLPLSERKYKFCVSPRRVLLIVKYVLIRVKKEKKI